MRSSKEDLLLTPIRCKLSNGAGGASKRRYRQNHTIAGNTRPSHNERSFLRGIFTTFGLNFKHLHYNLYQKEIGFQHYRSDSSRHLPSRDLRNESHYVNKRVFRRSDSGSASSPWAYAPEGREPTPRRARLFEDPEYSLGKPCQSINDTT